MSTFRNLLSKTSSVPGFVGGWKSYGRSNSEDASTPRWWRAMRGRRKTRYHIITTWSWRTGNTTPRTGVTYLCTRDTGIPVYNPLKDLVGLYVEVAE